MKEPNFIEALLHGSKNYESTNPCVRHGTVRRYTKNKGCMICAREAAAKQYMGKVGKIKNMTVRVYAEDMETVRAFTVQLLEMRKCGK